MFDYIQLTNDKVVICMLIVVVVAFSYQIVHIIIFRNKFSKCKTKYSGEIQYNLPPVSVVICIRDNYTAIKQYIPILLNQEYPDFEIIIVNYSSNDSYSEMLRAWSKQNNKLTLVQINEDSNFNCSIIYPLAIGIKASKNNLILVTDPNCRPSTIHWIRSMVSKLNSSKTNVAGISNYSKKNSFFNKLMRYEKARYNINLFSYLGVTNNYYVDTSNFLLTKNDVLKQKDLHNFFTIANDGSSIFNKFVNREATGVMINDYSQVFEEKKYSFFQWFSIVSSRYSNFRFVTTSTKFCKAIYIISLILLISGIITLLLYTHLNLLVLILSSLLLLLRFSLWYISRSKSLKDIGQKDLKFNILLYEIILLFLSPINYFSSLIIKHKLW